MRRQTVHGAHLALRHVQRQLTRVDRTTHEHPLRSPTQPICAATLEIAAYGETSLPRGGTPPRRPALQKRPLRRTAATARCGTAATRDRLIASLLGFVQLRSERPITAGAADCPLRRIAPRACFAPDSGIRALPWRRLRSGSASSSR